VACSLDVRHTTSPPIGLVVPSQVTLLYRPALLTRSGKPPALDEWLTTARFLPEADHFHTFIWSVIRSTWSVSELTTGWGIASLDLCRLQRPLRALGRLPESILRRVRLSDACPLRSQHLSNFMLVFQGGAQHLCTALFKHASGVIGVFGGSLFSPPASVRHVTSSLATAKPPKARA